MMRKDDEARIILISPHVTHIYKCNHYSWLPFVRHFKSEAVQFDESVARKRSPKRHGKRWHGYTGQPLLWHEKQQAFFILM